ncbi:hypothetical protein A2U01_0035579, partial [Trifolium medium]|nr:hypothetical protein [Trifolium medium]
MFYSKMTPRIGKMVTRDQVYPEDIYVEFRLDTWEKRKIMIM